MLQGARSLTWRLHRTVRQEEVYRAFEELSAKEEEEKQRLLQLSSTLPEDPSQDSAPRPHPVRPCAAESDPTELPGTLEERDEEVGEGGEEGEEGGERQSDCCSLGSKHVGEVSCDKGDAEPEDGTPALSTPHAADDDLDPDVNYIPGPREAIGVVPVKFTTRLFPTPLRESKVADESAWIMKNRKHLHKNKALVGKLPQAGQEGDLPVDISQSDPVWLKGRGDDLYRGGDFLGAANAYTAALDADPQAAPCLSNRAACFLRLGRAAECAADCGAALDILRARPGEGARQARVLTRRALAYRELGHYRLSLEDCRAALEFSPGDPGLTSEVAIAEPLAACEGFKREAAARFAAGDIESACKLYTAALTTVPALPSCLSNRAACHLALGRADDCARDCTAALNLLSARPAIENAWVVDQAAAVEEDTGTGAATASTPPSGVVPPPPGSMPPAGSEQRRAWVVSTLLRRGRAQVELGRLDGALRDYEEAHSLCPQDKAIEGDVRELERRITESQ